LLYTHTYTTFILYCVHILHSDYLVREIGFVQICLAEMMDNNFIKVIEMTDNDEMEEATTFFNVVYSLYIRRRIGYIMDGEFKNIAEKAEAVFQDHNKTIHAKAVLTKCLMLIEGKAGDMQLTDIVEEYNGNLPVNSIANPLPPPPGPSKVGKRPAVPVESAAAPALKRTAPAEPAPAAGGKKPIIKKVVSGPPPVNPPEPAAGGGAIRVKGHAPRSPAAAMPVISKS